jgi:hypothetical protein
MAKHLQAAEEQHRTSKSSDAKTIFNMEMKVIRNFHIHNRSREVTSAILE